MLRMIDRHPSAFVIMLLSLFATILEKYFGISHAFVHMAKSGTLVGLSATLVGFLITGLTILLAFKDKPSLNEVSETRAYRYVHKSFLYAIWFQVGLLIYSLALEVTFRLDYDPWVCIRVVFLYVTVIALALLLVCVYYLSLMVTSVISPKNCKVHSK